MLNLIKIIILGVVSVALAILAEQAVATAASIFWNQEIVLVSFTHFTWFLALTALVEEISKFWAVYFVMRKKFSLEKIYFVLGTLLLGFVWGIFEIGLILFSNQKLIAAVQSGNPELIFSFYSMIAMHTLTAFLMGIFISANIFSGRLKMTKILFFPLLIHMLFNFLIIQRGNLTNILIVLSLALSIIIGGLILSFNLKKLA